MFYCTYHRPIILIDDQRESMINWKTIDNHSDTDYKSDSEIQDVIMYHKRRGIKMPQVPDSVRKYKTKQNMTIKIKGSFL